MSESINNRFAAHGNMTSFQLLGSENRAKTPVLRARLNYKHNFDAGIPATGLLYE